MQFQTHLRTIGNGIDRQIVSMLAGGAGALIGLAYACFRIIYGLCLLFGILALLFALGTHAWAAWRMTGALFFWAIVMWTLHQLIARAIQTAKTNPKGNTHAR